MNAARIFGLDEIYSEIQNLDLTKAVDDTLVISEEAEEVLVRLLEIEDFIESAKKSINERFLVVAQANPKLKKYEGDKVSVGYRTVRRKIITGDPDKQFYKVKKEPNTKAIDAYREATGELPTGVDEKTYEYITFKMN